jgi:asparagine synthase (glutamine-hydrolysing)
VTALAGYWAFDRADDAEARCDRMLKAQVHFAPDPPVTRSEPGIALGRRLYRLLPEDAFDREPAVGAGSGAMLAADVRLDNRDELAEALDVSPAEAARLADAGLLMLALERWDEAALDRLVGDFAFAHWDPRRRRLLLARDHLGQRPLHFHRGDGFFAFASMPKGLHALPEIPIAPDAQAIADFLALMPETGSGSFFRGVERVEPGHLLLVRESGIETRKHWRPSLEPLRLAGADEYAEALREHFDRAVSARLRGSRGRVAAHLSGGLDSAAVAATAARLLAVEQGKVTAYTAVPGEHFTGRGVRNSIADEGPLAAGVAALHPNIEHVLIRSGAKSPFAELDRNFFFYERPVLNLCNMVWADAINADASRRGLRVLLTGNIGNMSISYDGMPLLSQLLARGRLLRLAREILLLRRHGTRLGTSAAQAFGPLIPAPIWRAIARLRGKGRNLTDYSAINPGLAAELGMTGRAAARGLDLSYRPRRDPIETRLWVLSRVDPGNYHKGNLGRWGIDTRDPTADRRLVEFCLRVPVEQFLSGGIRRALARRAFADRLPEALLRETRKGYQAADWHEGLSAARGELRDETARMVESDSASAAIDTDLLARLETDWPAGGWDEDSKIEKYRLALLRGVSTGHFVRKAAGSNR